jgi:hypothetical protein
MNTNTYECRHFENEQKSISLISRTEEYDAKEYNANIPCKEFDLDNAFCFEESGSCEVLREASNSEYGQNSDL